MNKRHAVPLLLVACAFAGLLGFLISAVDGSDAAFYAAGVAAAAVLTCVGLLIARGSSDSRRTEQRTSPERPSTAGSELPQRPSSRSTTPPRRPGERLLEAHELDARVRELADQINTDYRDRDLVLVGVLKGSIYFLAKLMSHITVPFQLDFVWAASYGDETQSTGDVRILGRGSSDLSGLDVLVVEDIVETGFTMREVLWDLGKRHPASLSACVLLVKPESVRVNLEKVRYVGFPDFPDRFVVGYGMDYAEQFRYLPYIAVLEPADR